MVSSSQQSGRPIRLWVTRLLMIAVVVAAGAVAAEAISRALDGYRLVPWRYRPRGRRGGE